MKLESDFYIQELVTILSGIDLQIENCAKFIKKEKLKAQIFSFLTPWRSSAIWGDLAANAEMLIIHVQMMAELRQKILNSEYPSDNTLPVTLREILSSKN